ncbi:rho guanine nucleotide exchange factor 15-like [Heterodontus francisci]|uniref:rho guanine nucleotide exchange factor 15-like n=1 Tax=Heterodontus francisci TaxID=7792 RepID=UPI00355C5A67
MTSAVKGPPEAEMQKRAARQKPKPPVKPKPPALARSAGKQGGTQISASPEPSAEADGLKSSAEGQSTCPPVPARRQVSDMTAGGEALSSSGNVRKMRELFNQALGLSEGEDIASKDKLPQSLGRSESARDLPAGSLPVPKARRKPMVRAAAPLDVPASDDRDEAPRAAKRPLSDLRPSQDVSTGLRLEATPEHHDAAEDPEAQLHCCPTCPCICHRKRPGMVLVWTPVRNSKEDTDESDNSLSDLSENGTKTFDYVFHVSSEDREGASGKDVNANHCPGWDETGIRLTGIEKTGADGAREQWEGADQPPTSLTGRAEPAISEGGVGVLPKSDRRSETRTHLDEALPEAAAKRESTLVNGKILPGEDSRPVTVSRLPKPPRRNKPVSQLSLEGKDDPQVSPRRLAQVRRRPGEPPSDIKQRYTASDLDKISKCVDGLNLHIRKLEFPQQQRDPPSPLRPSAGDLLKLPSPKVTRSAPPSPKEKRLQAVYNEIDIGDGDGSGSNTYEDHLEILESRPAKPEKVTDWEAQFESEPLYQTYRETVINKEIKRQTLMRDSSKTSEDYTYESISLVPDSDTASHPAPRPQTPRNSLWQNLSVVRQSGILNELSQSECRLQESMFEVLTSEASYLRSLNVLIEHFMNNKDLNETIILRDKKTLFSCITRVKEVSESFLKDLEDRMDESIKIDDVCDIIYLHAQHSFQVYVDYVRNQLYQEQKYSKLMEENAQFAAVIVRLQEQPRCQRLPFMSFLLLPFQRITRIKMLIENVLQRSEVGSGNEETASKALGLVSKIIEECNREVGIMKQVEEMIHIRKKLEFDKLKAIPIISQLRHLEKQGELSEIVFRGNLFGMKPKVVSLYFFLFNDLLLITSRKSGDRYQVVDHAHRSLVEVQECSSNSLGAGIGNCFMLTLLENHQGKQSDRLLKTSTESDRHRWMDALMSGKQNLLEDSNDDKIYERWDCPQMQCLIPYTAQQADELSLEPADIINVTRKSSEGWYEGSKLSNGKKGWFPSKNVQEITNEHVRRRNLRDRYRLLQAAQQVQQSRDAEDTRKANASL